jgi:hypothetical protein
VLDLKLGHRLYCLSSNAITLYKSGVSGPAEDAIC